MTSKIKLILVGLIVLIFAVYLMPIKDRAVYVSGDTYIDREVEMEVRASNILWTEVATSTSWSTRDSVASFVFKDKMYLMGGINGNNEVKEGLVSYWLAPHYNDIWSSEDGAVWRLETAKASWPPRRSMSVLEFGESLYMFGGWSPILGYTNEVWTSLDGVTWSRITSTSLWSAREGQTTELFLGKMWIMGGVNYDERQTKNDVWYSSDAVVWEKVATSSPWSPRWDHATAIFKDKMYLMGGMNLSGETFNDLWSSEDGLSWQRVPTPSWQSRQGHELLVYNDYLWVIGRLDDNKEGGDNDVWYSKDGVDWRKTNANPPWLGREDHSALVYKNQIFIFGGMDKNWRWRNDVWSASF